MTNVVPVQPARGVVADMASRYGMVPEAFEATVRATCMPGTNVSREQFAAFLLVAKEYNLNPLTKEVYAFPSRGGIQPIVSIDGWMNLINSHPTMDGLEFEDHFDGEGKLAGVTCRIFRKDRSRPTTVTEYMAECRRNTDVWKQWPARMLRHKAAIQAARYAFGFSGIMEPDEFERMHEAPAAPGLRARLAEQRTPAVEGFTVAHAAMDKADAVEVDPDTGELLDAAHGPASEADTPFEPDGAGLADEFDIEDLLPPKPDPDSPEGVLCDLQLLLEEANTAADVAAAKSAMAPKLNKLPPEGKATARAMIAEATERVG